MKIVGCPGKSNLLVPNYISLIELQNFFDRYCETGTENNGGYSIETVSLGKEVAELGFSLLKNFYSVTCDRPERYRFTTQSELETSFARTEATEGKQTVHPYFRRVFSRCLGEMLWENRISCARERPSKRPASKRSYKKELLRRFSTRRSSLDTYVRIFRPNVSRGERKISTRTLRSIW